MSGFDAQQHSYHQLSKKTSAELGLRVLPTCTKTHHYYRVGGGGAAANRMICLCLCIYPSISGIYVLVIFAWGVGPLLRVVEGPGWACGRCIGVSGLRRRFVHLFGVCFWDALGLCWPPWPALDVLLSPQMVSSSEVFAGFSILY